jgi:hypothetical protein
MAGCAGGLGQTLKESEDEYLLARMEYNDILSEYLELYEQQDEMTQMVWKETIDPKFKPVSTALTAWGKAIKAAKAAEEETDQLKTDQALTDAEKAFQKALPALLSLVEPLLTKGGGS